MKNIAVKVHNTNKTVQQAQVVTQDGQPTVIQAQKGVNYEFLDQATGRAPHHIITKREGNDLHVSFEENGKEADLIIEDFYSYPDSGLIGLAENGQYYNYIPDTGSVQDYVTQLNVGDVEGQALGGEGFPAPWWVAGNADMNVFPWLLGLGAIGAIAAIVSDDDDNNNNVTPTPTPNTVILSNLSVANLSDGSNNVQITGKVQINSEDARAGTTVDITLPNGKIVPATVGDNGQYSVILSDAESLNALKQGPKVTASKDNVTDIFNLTPAPKIDPVSKQDTTVTGTAEPNSEVTVKGKAGKELGKATTDANGKWSLPVPAGTELTSGEDLTATATKAGSNPSLRDDEIVTPPKPTINPVDETSPISGTAEPNQKVEVTLPNGTTASTVSDDKGNWIVPNPGLNKGDKLTAEAVVSVDGKDIKSEPQPENVIDNTPPSEPQINPVKDGDTTVSGTAEPNSKVTLTDKDGNKIGETTADDKGNWTTKVTTPLKEGDEVKATATDASGNPSQPAEQLVVDTNAPNAPDIKPIADDNKPISGTAEPNSTVTVTFPDGKTATTKADDKGNWSVPNPGLNPGDKVTATATDANGNESPKANGSVNDTTPPQQPVINGVKESDDTVTGTAEPNSTVTVTFPNGTTATVNADKDGKWSVPADPSVKDGGKITATARDNAGNTSEKAEEPIVDDLAPPAPSVNPITEGNPITGTAQPNTTITIKDKDGNTIGTATTDDKGNWSVPAHPNVKTGDEVTATATDQAGNTSSPTKEVVIDDKAPSEPSINPIKDGDTTITGTAEPNSTVSIDTNGDGTPDKTVKADDKGNFTATVDTPLKAGDKVTATATDKAGNTSKPANEPVVDTTAPNQPDILPIDGDNKEAPIKGTAEPNSTVTVTFPDGKTATTKADDKGNWELPNPGLNTGDKVTATAKDNSGKESSPAEAVVNGDITPPAKPTVNVSDDGKTITGTAEPNSTVEIDTNGDGQPDITTKADENGNYTAPLDKPLTNGETVTARAKDPAGNISAPATDTAPDTQPTETAINDKGDTVTVTGAKPGDTVTVKDPATGETIGTGTVGNDGKATITLDKPITNGETVPVTVGTEDKPVTAPDTVPTNTSINPTGDTVTVTGAKPGDTVTVKDPATGETIGTGTVGKDGKVEIPLTKPITDGSTIPVTVGEENKPVTAPDASDKTAPNAPTTAPDMTPETDTGAKNDDNITKNDKPSFVVPAPQEGETPVLLVDGKEVPADFDPNTNTLTPKQPIEPGKHKVTTAVKDSAGNVSDPSPELAIEIDKTAPNAPTTA
ncbi:Ig-like domain-containing protein, partial [Faucicola boevrei]|uniref:Ig-like domain-containing protein n=1 Tax=Faucicola boevrei TaxID=346665 RepID=UPI0003647F0C